MNFLSRYLPRIDFDSYQDFKDNYRVNIPGNFNFGYDIVDEYARLEPSKPALLWLNDDGDPTGLNVELITAALNDMGAKCVFEVSDKDKAVSDFEAFETNLMLSPLVEKIPGVYYGKYEVATYRVVLAQRKDARQIAKLSELRPGEVVVGNKSGYPLEKALSMGLLKPEQVQYKSVKLALEGMARGEIDYFIVGEKTIEYIINRYNLGDLINVTPIDVPAGKLRFVSRDKQLIEALDNRCNQMEQNGSLHRLTEKWLEGAVEASNMPTVGLFVVFYLLTAFCFFLLINRIVNNRLKKALRNILDTNNIVRTALEMGGNYIICTNMKTHKVKNMYGDLIKPSQELDMYDFFEKIHTEDTARIKDSFQRLMKDGPCIETLKYGINQ